MGLFFKIFLIVLVIFAFITLILSIIIGVTVYQGYTLYKEYKNSNIQSDIEELAKGNCSKTADVDFKYNGLKQKAKSPCRNLIIKWTLSKTGYDVCVMVAQNNSELDTTLQFSRDYCAFIGNATLPGQKIDWSNINITVPEKLKEKFPQIINNLKDELNRDSK